MKIGNSSEIAAAVQGLVDRPGGTQQKNRTNAPAGSVGGAAPAADASTDTGVQVDLSSAAARLLDGGSDSESFDAAKVDRITQAIAEGRFSVNAEAVADKLMANTQEILGRQQSTH